MVFPQRLSLGREDVFMNLVEVTEENWSFGNGEVQLATRLSISKKGTLQPAARCSGSGRAVPVWLVKI